MPSLIGKSGSKVAELRDKFKVRISFPRRQPHQPQQPRAQPAAGDASAKPQETASRQQQQQQQQQATTDTQDTSDLPANTTTSSVPLTNGHSEHTTAEAPATAEAVPTPAANENEKPVAEEEKPAETVQPSAEESTEKPVEANAAPSTISWAEEMERTVEEQLEEVVIVGYKDRADACRAEIERLVALAAAHTTEELFIDGSIHRRLIGARVFVLLFYGRGCTFFTFTPLSSCTEFLDLCFEDLFSKTYALNPICFIFCFFACVTYALRVYSCAYSVSIELLHVVLVVQSLLHPVTRRNREKMSELYRYVP